MFVARLVWAGRTDLWPPLAIWMHKRKEKAKPMVSGSLGFVALLGALLVCLEEGFEFGHKRNIYGSLPASNFDYPLERKPCMRRMSFRGNQRKFAGGRFLFGLMTGLMRRCGCFLCFARAIATGRWRLRDSSLVCGRSSCPKTHALVETAFPALAKIAWKKEDLSWLAVI